VGQAPLNQQHVAVRCGFLNPLGFDDAVPHGVQVFGSIGSDDVGHPVTGGLSTSPLLRASVGQAPPNHSALLQDSPHWIV
jgi:hypothetical protein